MLKVSIAFSMYITLPVWPKECCFGYVGISVVDLLLKLSEIRKEVHPFSSGRAVIAAPS